MGYGNQPKKRTFKLTVAVMVDDASKYDAEMERFCSLFLGEVRAAHRNLTAGNPDETLVIEPLPND